MSSSELLSALSRIKTGSGSSVSLDKLVQKAQEKKDLEENALGLVDMIVDDQYVGEVVNLVFDKAKVQVNDFFKKRVGGIPANCFLIATRMSPNSKKMVSEMSKEEKEDFYYEEENSVILLRVVDSALLAGEMDKERIVTENAASSQGKAVMWDESMIDPNIKQKMSFSGLSCRVIGTFFMEENDKGAYELKFGNDLSNFYPNRSLRVYKPSSEALSAIVNFGINESSGVKFANVRYSSTNRKGRGISDVAVRIDPNDLVAQKTALFGMTRSGKSNSLKIIAKSMYLLRHTSGEKIGQLIFDVNGEYANENVQDVNASGQAQALRNVWEVKHNGHVGSPKDVVTYGLMGNAKDPKRILMKINFYNEELIQIGKDLIDEKLVSDTNQNALYIKSFTSVQFENLAELSSSPGAYNRELRKRLIYKTILFDSGFKDENDGKVYAPNKKLFSDKLITSMHLGIKDYEDLNDNKQKELAKNLNRYREAAEILERYNTNGSTYTELSRAFVALVAYTKDNNSTYEDFEKDYVKSSDSGSRWLDVNTSSLLETFAYKNAAKRIKKATVYHDVKATNKDYTDMIYDDLALGRLVIVDQALGDSELNKLAAERILRKIFENNNKVFSDALTPPPVLVYIEEAHNMLPKGSEEDTTNIWARTAKEGAKFNLGMVYSTQEVSSIQKNILKSTANWFISHLNNKEELRTLSDYYDFSDFAESIIQSEDKGFIRMKTKSNRFVVPIQVDKFEINVENK